MLRAGEQIGPYTLISKLGRGAFGTVWLSERRTTIATTTAALKIPLDDDVDLETIKHEANLWVRASGHPNVLPIIEANIYDEQVIIASEYAPDGSLEAWLKQNGGKSPSVEVAIEIVSGILSGLEHLHARNIIHRDIKPANILFQGNTPRLADFGISRVLKSTSQSSIVAGTPAYMAPEAFDGKRNEQTDIWSVGVIFYHLLAGRLPFAQADITSLVGAILSRNPDPLPISVPSPLQEIIACALTKDPSQRYKSAAEMRADLRNPKPKNATPKPHYATEPATTIPAYPVRTMPPEPLPLHPTQKSNFPHAVYAVAGLLAVLIVVAGVVWLKSGGTNTNSNNLSVVPRENTSEARTTPTSAATPTPRQAERRTITVDARRMWVDTGITLADGESLVMQANGQWANSTPHVPYGPNGLNNTWRGTVLETANNGSLIGKVGSSMFPIGAYYSGYSPASGRLYLSMNDVPGTYSDNWGTVSVQITYGGN